MLHHGKTVFPQGYELCLLGKNTFATFGSLSSWYVSDYIC